MLNEIYKHLEGSDTVYDFADAVVVVRLKMTRDMYLDEIERLDNLQELNEWQKEDYEDLSADVLAINRVLGFYTWTEDDD
jgi:hypothetical protein